MTYNELKRNSGMTPEQFAIHYAGEFLGWSANVVKDDKEAVIKGGGFALAHAVYLADGIYRALLNDDDRIDADGAKALRLDLDAWALDYAKAIES